MNFPFFHALRLAPSLAAVTAFATPPAPEPAPAPAPANANAGSKANATTGDGDEMFATGKALFEAYAPPAIQEQFAFPTREEWDAFAARLEKTRETGSLAELAAYEPQAKVALVALRGLPEYKNYADWLTDRLDEIEVAKDAGQNPAVLTPVPPVPGLSPTPPATPEIPLYDLWVGRMRDRPRPARVTEFLPKLQKIFVAEGVPAEFAWLAETESMFRPDARSPVGASGLFQLMPATARALGLSLFPLDDRNDPAKSAHAAAKLLHGLHDRFGTWPLALAAYNAGEGRVGRLLKKQDAKTFAEIAATLPTETRLYVPRVLATVAVRTGVAPSQLGSPGKPIALD